MYPKQAITCSLTANQQYEGEKNTLLGILLSGDFPCTVWFFCTCTLHAVGYLNFIQVEKSFHLKKLNILGQILQRDWAALAVSLAGENLGYLWQSYPIFNWLSLRPVSQGRLGQPSDWCEPCQPPVGLGAMNHGGVLVTLSLSFPHHEKGGGVSRSFLGGSTAHGGSLGRENPPQAIGQRCAMRAVQTPLTSQHPGPEPTCDSECSVH